MDTDLSPDGDSLDQLALLLAHVRIREHLARHGALTADQDAEILAVCDVETERLVRRAVRRGSDPLIRPGGVC